MYIYIKRYLFLNIYLKSVARSTQLVVVFNRATRSSKRFYFKLINMSA